MKNKIFILAFFLILNFNFSNYSYSAEQFNFDVTEIEIYDKGNKFKGIKRGKITTKDGIILNADTFEYDKILNILDAKGNVILKDIINDVVITSSNIIYDRAKEIIFTNNRSNVIGSNSVIDADFFLYNKNLNTLNAKGNVKIVENTKNVTLFSEDITYYKNSEKIISREESVAISDGLEIQAKEIQYNKILNILNASSNVKIHDQLKDIIVYTEDITYLKNKEKIFTQGSTEVLIESKYDFKSKDTILLRNQQILSSSHNQS